MARAQDVIYLNVRFPRTDSQGGDCQTSFKMAMLNATGGVDPITNLDQLAPPLQAFSEGWEHADGWKNAISLEHGTNAYLDVWVESSVFGIEDGTEIRSNWRANTNECFTGGFSAKVTWASPRLAGERDNCSYFPELPQSFVGEDDGSIGSAYATIIEDGWVEMGASFATTATAWSLVAVHGTTSPRVAAINGYQLASKASFLQRRYH